VLVVEDPVVEVFPEADLVAVAVEAGKREYSA
jgi:hypothetical protein